MAIVPQGNLNTNRSAGAANEHDHSDEHQESTVEVNVNRVLKNIYESSYAALSELDPVDCVDGNCPTIEIPIIICMNNITAAAKTALGVMSNVTMYPDPVFGQIAETVEKGNDLLTTGRVDDSISRGAIEVGETYPTAKSENVAGVTKYYANHLDFGYYTGEQVFNTNKQELEDEFISFRTLKELYPNIKFIFPTKIRTEILLDAFSKFFNLRDVYNDVLNKDLPQEFNSEFIYFPEDTPGLLEIDLSIFNEHYFNRLDYVSSIVLSKDPSTTNVSLYSEGFNDTYADAYISVPGANYVFNLSSIAYINNTHFPYSTQSSSADNKGGSYSTNVTSYYYEKFKNTNTHLHEFFHGAANAGHSWYVPQMSGFETENLDGWNFLTLLGGEQVLSKTHYSVGIVFPHILDYEKVVDDYFNNNILDNPLKPPFAYNVLNPDYSRIKRDSDNADADYQDFEDKVASGEITIGSMYENIFYEQSGVRTWRVQEALSERKNSLNAKLQITPEYISGDYNTIGGDEKEFVEFYIKNYIKHITNNFTSKYTFTQGAGITPEIIAPITARVGEAPQVYTGIPSFWGGSYVLNNPPVVGSEFEDPINGVLYKIINIKDQRYATVIKALPESITIDEAQAVINSQSDSLWRFPTETELDSLSRIAYEGYEGGDATTMTVKVKIELELDFYPGAAFVAYEDDIKRYIFNVAGDSPSNPFVDITNTDESFYQANLFMVKDIDLLEDDTISTSFVVNPTNDDGARKGPDVTSYIPFCTIEDDENGDPKPTDTYDVTWALNYNSYNPDYPPYPDNTKITDLLNEEYCPCLYKQQSYIDEEGLTKTYTIIKEGSTFTALKDLIDDLPNSGDVKIFKEFLRGFFMFIQYKYNNNYIIPETFTTLSDTEKITNPLLYRYSDLNNPYLEMVPAVGYYGFGYCTTIPKEFNINPFEAFIEKMNIVDQTVFENSPINAYFSPSGGYSGSLLRVYFPTPLRYGSYEKGLGTLRSLANTQMRYQLGSSNPNSDIYNPLNEKFNTTYNADELSAGATEDYLTDFSGSYNPLNMSDVMQYGHNVGVLSNNVIPPHIVRGTNYIFNSNSYIATAYRTIAKDSTDPNASSVSVGVGEVVRLYGDNYLIFSIKNNVVIDQGMQSGNIANEVFAVKISEGIEGNLHDIYFYSDPFNEDAYNEGDYDFISYGVSLQEMQDNYGFLSDADDLSNHHFRELRAAFMEHPLDFNTTTAIFKIVSIYHTHLHFNRISWTDYDTQWSWQADHLYNYQDMQGVKNDFFTPELTVGRIDDTAELLNVLESNKNNINTSNLSSAYNNRRGFIFRKFFVTDAQLQGEPEKYYIKNAFEAVAEDISDFNVEGQTPGCTDINAFNFNPEATFNNGSCVEKIFGCIHDWADNYDEHANVDDGSCVATLCLNTSAAGEWGFGYNAGLVSQVESYSPSAIIPAEGSPVLSVDESEGFEVCQFLLEKRAAIMKVVCLGVSDDLTSSVCNDNEVVKVIQDLDTNSISSYSSNPTVVDINLKDLIEEVLVIGVRPNDGVKININTYPFADGVSQYDIEANRDYAGDYQFQNLFLRVIEEEVFLINTSGSNVNSSMFGSDKHIKYNCVENPILPDGSGGCLLYSFESQEGPAEYRLQGCVIPEIESKTPEDCFNEILFEGGYISDATIVSQENSFTEGVCKSNESKYVIPNNMRGYSLTGNNSNITLSVATKDLLPLYSVYQASEQTGYPTNILRSAQLSEGLQGSLIEDPDEYSISAVLYLLNPNFLFTEDGVSYTGPYKYRIVSGTKVYYIHEESNPFVEGGANTLRRLFTRNELLDNGIANSEVELTANNFNEIVNEINNLTIFTDN